MIGNSIGPLPASRDDASQARCFFARCLRERFELDIKKAAMRGFFFFASRTARSGHLPRYAVRNDGLGAGEPVRVVTQPESRNVLENFV